MESVAAKEKTELERRVYYQGIVYDVCNLIDRYLKNKVGSGVVCGSAETPTKNVQEALLKIMKERAPSYNFANPPCCEASRYFKREYSLNSNACPACGGSI